MNLVGVYTNTYSVVDASGNSNSITRQITVHDGTAPIITVTDGTVTTVDCHTSYTDAGATATDTCDANPTVVSTNGLPIDVNTPGNYTITYTAADASGNTSTPTRLVIVQDKGRPAVNRVGAASNDS